MPYICIYYIYKTIKYKRCMKIYCKSKRSIIEEKGQLDNE